jgi:hypothetical protein
MTKFDEIFSLEDTNQLLYRTRNELFRLGLHRILNLPPETESEQIDSHALEISRRIRCIIGRMWPNMSRTREAVDRILYSTNSGLVVMECKHYVECFVAVRA